MSRRIIRLSLTFILCGILEASAAIIVVSGTITQSTQDGTGPAVNNLSLNDILTLQPYTLTLVTSTDLTSPGLYDLTGSQLEFAVPDAPALEDSFGQILLNLTPNGLFTEFSLFACVTTGDCLTGNSLSANFSVPTANLKDFSVVAIGLDQPHPLNLLEDDGTTDIQGTITSYSAVPEPSFVTLVGMACLSMLAIRRALNQ